jgi:hypothetical protein
VPFTERSFHGVKQLRSNHVSATGQRLGKRPKPKAEVEPCRSTRVKRANEAPERLRRR